MVFRPERYDHRKGFFGRSILLWKCSRLTDGLRDCRAAAFAVLLFLGVASSCSMAFAQSGAGSIQGTVTDVSGAVIQSASIHIVQQGTNLAFDTKSNGEGFYQVPDLFTGTYNVTVTAPGFRSYTTPIELLVAQNAVVNAALTTGSVTQQVQVSAYTVDLTTTTSGVIDSTLENQRINQLPMNGRFLGTLADETTPGLESGGASGAAGARLNDLEQGALEYEVDGAPIIDRAFGGVQSTYRQTPDPDSIQEFKIVTSDAGAEYASPGTAIMTTKSGSNELHGSLFETARNNGLGAALARQDPAGYVAPQLVRNEFGANVGGPIVLPHVYDGKDKSFWFFGWETYSQRTYTYSLEAVPTLAMRNGDWSGLINGSGQQITLYDPNTTVANAACPTPTGGTANNTWCRTPFPTVNELANQIPTSRESPVAKTLMAVTPQPTTADDPLVEDNASVANPDNIWESSYTFRLDHDFDNNNRVYLSNTIVLGSALQEIATVAGDGIPYGEWGGESFPSAFFATALGFTHVFSPSFFSETVASMENIDHRYIFEGNVTNDYESQFGLPNNFGEIGVPSFTGLLYPLTGNQGQYWLSQKIENLDENLTKISGKHQMQFGGRFRLQPIGSMPTGTDDAIAFSAEATALVNPSTFAGKTYAATSATGYADADEFIGAASSYTANLEPHYQHFHQMELDGYFQDNYHVSKNVTANLGLRYEAHPAPTGILDGFDLKNDALVLGPSVSTLIAEGLTTQAIITNDENDGAKIETAQEAGWNSKLMRSYELNFLPRVAFAWQPLGGRTGTVLRGGYGRYTYLDPVRYNVVPQETNNPFAATYTMSYIAANQSPDGNVNFLMRAPQSAAVQTSGVASSAGTPIMGVNTANVVNSSTTTSILPGSSGLGLFTNNYDDAPDFVTEINTTVEQSFKLNSALRVSWVYTHGSNLVQCYKYNNKPSNFEWEMATGTALPTGTAYPNTSYSGTAEDPYDQLTWGSGATLIQKNGWSNDNALQADYRRLYHSGFAYQAIYAWSKPMRVGGYYQNDSLIYPTQNFANNGGVSTITPVNAANPAPTQSVPLPPRPAGVASYEDYHALDRYENYLVDTAIPKQHLQFNGIYDLPFGRGKRFLGNANRLVDTLVGGFQIAGDGSMTSQDFWVSSTNWGPTNPIHVYKHAAPITDCRSGVCRKAYMWFNGYIPPTEISGNPCAAGLSTVVSGLPANYAPYQSPIDTVCSAPVGGKAVTDQYFGDNEVNLTLPGSTKASAIAYVPSIAATSTNSIGDNPFTHTVIDGPLFWNTDASIFKVLPITERVRLRFNMDVFNALNVQGYNNPSASDGTEQLTSSKNTPRLIQLTLRLQF
jgi:hypothetical protein